MSMQEAGQAAERDERERDEYEQQQSRVLMALMQGFCTARYRKADNTPCPVDQGLYLGSVGAALNKEALKTLNITHILIVARSLNPAFPAEFTYKKIEVFDSPDTDLVKHFSECFTFIDEGISTSGNVLVHCFAGRSRSVTVVLAYLMKKHKMSLESAMSLVRSKRPQVGPNEGFMSQLENFEKSLQVEEESTSALEEVYQEETNVRETCQLLVVIMSHDLLLFIISLKLFGMIWRRNQDLRNLCGTNNRCKGMYVKNTLSVAS